MLVIEVEVVEIILSTIIYSFLLHKLS